MEKYNYLENVTEDVKNYINENVNFTDYEDAEDLKEKLQDELWTVDSVTGNGSGSYTFNAWTAEENLCHNLYLLAEANEELGVDKDVLSEGAEACDVTIRCYLLPQAIDAAVDELWEEPEEDEENED